MVKDRYAVVFAAIMVVVGVQADSISHGGTTIVMDFVDIGHASNANDSSGYGGVAYNYRIGQHEVKASQWAAVIAADSNVGNGGSWAGSQPTASANWYEAARFCNWLTTGDAYTGVYQFNGSGVLTGFDRSYRNGNGMAYMLPSENEWYKAAYFKSDGSGYTLYATGDTIPGLDTDANYSGGAFSDPWGVGSGSAENNGTFDMNGNVWEWTDGAGSAILSNNISFWGGAYNSNLSTLQSGAPFFDTPNLQHQAIGMRVVAIPEPGTFSLMSLSTIGLFFTRTLRRRKLMGKSLFPGGHECLCDSYCSLEECGIIRIEAPKLDIW